MVDVVKTRLQIQRISEGKAQYSGTVDTLTQIVRQEGYVTKSDIDSLDFIEASVHCSCLRRRKEL